MSHSLVERAVLASIPTERRYPPLFIVGVPRAGTTLVFQHLLNSFRFAYVSNLAEDHPNAPVTYSLVSRVLGGRTPTRDNQLGQTPGATGASDGWNLFERWFPRYALEPVDQNGLSTELPQIVGALEWLYDGPLVNKNNHHSVRIDHLHRIFTDARFVHVTRDHRSAALSLRDAREEADVAVGEWWSCPAPQFTGRRFESQLEQAAFTVVGIERHLERALEGIPDAQTLRVGYEPFCDEPNGIARDLQESYATDGIELERLPTSLDVTLRASRRTADDPEKLDRLLDRAETAFNRQ